MGGYISQCFDMKEYYGWRKDYKTDLDNMWQSHKNKYCGGISQFCDKCDGNYTSTCECSKKRYINSITYDQLQEFLRDKLNRVSLDIDMNIKKGINLNIR